MSDYNYEYQEQNDPLESTDERYHAKTRTETNKNIKLLNEILVAQKSPRAPMEDEESEERPIRKRKGKGKKEKLFAFSIETLKDPLLMIVLYVIVHTSQVNNLFVRYLPKNITNPDNIFLYYGSRGAVFTVIYYLASRYLKHAL